jgi:hypothetical protein
MQPLEQTQREFFAALQLPLRGRSRTKTDLPSVTEGHSAEFLSTAERLMKHGASLSPAESLELYHRQYWFRLLDSIAEDFLVLQRMAGEEGFWRLIEEYLLACPSSSFTLRHLGSRVADFIAGWPVLVERQRAWFSAIARLEYAYMEIYEAAEWEPVAPADLATAVVGLQPSVRLLELPVPADLCATWERFTPVDEVATFLAVWRGDDGFACQCRLDATEFALLKRLRMGGTLASLFDQPFGCPPEPDSVARWFSEWQRRRWIAIPPAADVTDFAVVHHRPVGDIDWSRIDKMGSQARSMDE